MLYFRGAGHVAALKLKRPPAQVSRTESLLGPRDMGSARSRVCYCCQEDGASSQTLDSQLVELVQYRVGLPTLVIVSSPGKTREGVNVDRWLAAMEVKLGSEKLKMAFDWAGSSTASDSDGPYWDEVSKFSKQLRQAWWCQRPAIKESLGQALKRTQWWDRYKYGIRTMVLGVARGGMPKEPSAATDSNFNSTKVVKAQTHEIEQCVFLLFCFGQRIRQKTWYSEDSG